MHTAPTQNCAPLLPNDPLLLLLLRLLRGPPPTPPHPCVIVVQVWQFSLENVVFKLNTTGNSSMNNAQEYTCDKAKVVCVDAKLLEQS